MIIIAVIYDELFLLSLLMFFVVHFSPYFSWGQFLFTFISVELV